MEIPKGTTAPEVIQRLNAAEFAPHPRSPTGCSDTTTSLVSCKPGSTCSRRGRRSKIALKLREGPAHPEVSLTIPGETLWHLGARLERAGLSTSEALITLASERSWAKERGLPVGPKRSARPDGVAHTYLEGFLTPETHFFAPDASLEEVLIRLTAKFESMWKRLSQTRHSDLKLLQEQYGLTRAQIVTLASLVEREAKVPRRPQSSLGSSSTAARRDALAKTDQRSSTTQSTSTRCRASAAQRRLELPFRPRWAAARADLQPDAPRT